MVAVCVAVGGTGVLVAVGVLVRVGVGVGGQRGPAMVPNMEPAPTLMPKVTLGSAAKLPSRVTLNWPVVKPGSMSFHLTPVRPV